MDSNEIILNISHVARDRELCELDASWSCDIYEEYRNTRQEMMNMLAEQIGMELDREIINTLITECREEGYCDIFSDESLDEYRKKIENEYKFK